METRKCPECGFQIIGRTDKVFCSDACRTRHNNSRNREQNQSLKRIDRILRNNRRIIMDLISSGSKEVARQSMIDYGFDFNYFTNFQTRSTGSVWYFCYDVGYMLMDADTLQLGEMKKR